MLQVWYISPRCKPPDSVVGGRVASAGRACFVGGAVAMCSNATVLKRVIMANEQVLSSSIGKQRISYFTSPAE